MDIICIFNILEDSNCTRFLTGMCKQISNNSRKRKLNLLVILGMIGIQFKSKKSIKLN